MATAVDAQAAYKEIKMKYLVALLSLLFIPLSAEAQQPERKVVKPPVVKSVPRDFTRPQPQRPGGFGKQEWQRPQQPQVKPSHNYRHGSIIIGTGCIHQRFIITTMGLQLLYSHNPSQFTPPHLADYSFILDFKTKR